MSGRVRRAAAALMLVGISLVGAVTAAVAAWFITQTRDATQAEEADLAARLTRIEATLAEIHRTLRPATRTAPTRED